MSLLSNVSLTIITINICCIIFAILLSLFVSDDYYINYKIITMSNAISAMALSAGLLFHITSQNVIIMCSTIFTIIGIVFAISMINIIIKGDRYSYE